MRILGIPPEPRGRHDPRAPARARARRPVAEQARKAGSAAARVLARRDPERASDATKAATKRRPTRLLRCRARRSRAGRANSVRRRTTVASGSPSDSTSTSVGLPVRSGGAGGVGRPGRDRQHGGQLDPQPALAAAAADHDLDGGAAIGGARQLLDPGDVDEAELAGGRRGDGAQPLVVGARARQHQVGAQPLDARGQRLTDACGSRRWRSPRPPADRARRAGRQRALQGPRLGRRCRRAAR